MKLRILFFLSIIFFYSCLAQARINLVDSPNKTLLPNPFPVYTDGTIVVNHPYPGFKQTLLPTINDDRSNPGCYIICYSHQSKDAIYQVSKDVFVHGQIRVPGKYVNRICVPKGYEGKDISKEDIFKKMCNAKILTCQDCWAGGDSGGWFGIQQ